MTAVAQNIPSPPLESDQPVEDLQAALAKASLVSGPDPAARAEDRCDSEDIPSRRPYNAPSTWGIAVYAVSDQFKLFPGRGTNKPALDFSHFFSRDAVAHQPNWLKSIAKYFTKADLLSLCGGLPSPDYFPFPTIQIEYRDPETGQPAGKHIKNGLAGLSSDASDVFPLSTALNYGQGSGSSQMIRWVTEHTELVHAPQYPDWACTLTIGTTSSTDIMLRMFCNPGDSVLVEQYGFAAAFQAIRSQQLHPVGIVMDSEGIMPSSLDAIMASWPSDNPARPRPRIMYIVPSGQNPTGATMSLQRRRDILALAQKHDLIILEDEPYYFLQMDPPSAAKQEQTEGVAAEPGADRRRAHRAFLSKLVPSLLSLDQEGRVLRLDSFSKVVAPASRCGWVTGPAHIVHRFQMYSDLATQGPAGWSQAALFQLLDETWGHAGYLDWLIHLREGYTRRRQVILDACEALLPADRDLISWVTPQAGMFLWLHINAARHPSRASGSGKGLSTAEVETDVFDIARERHDVLILRGSCFLADDAPSAGVPALTAAHPDDVCFRLAYSSLPAEVIVESVRRLGNALRDVFELPQP